MGQETGRRAIQLSIPIEALLRVLSGKASIKLPDDVPADLIFDYAYLDYENQLLKILVCHPSFELKAFGQYVKTENIEVESLEVEEPQPEGYSGESAVTSDDWARLV